MCSTSSIASAESRRLWLDGIFNRSAEASVFPCVKFETIHKCRGPALTLAPLKLIETFDNLGTEIIEVTLALFQFKDGVTNHFIRVSVSPRIDLSLD
jgi:hypothetical protein